MPVRRETVRDRKLPAPDAGTAGREMFDAGSVILYGALAGSGGARKGSA